MPFLIFRYRNYFTNSFLRIHSRGSNWPLYLLQCCRGLSSVGLSSLTRICSLYLLTLRIILHTADCHGETGSWRAILLVGLQDQYQVTSEPCLECVDSLFCPIYTKSTSRANSGSFPSRIGDFERKRNGTFDRRESRDIGEGVIPFSWYCQESNNSFASLISLFYRLHWFSRDCTLLSRVFQRDK
jgi:hypothetical protein